MGRRDVLWARGSFIAPLANVWTACSYRLVVLLMGEIGRWWRCGSLVVVVVVNQLRCVGCMLYPYMAPLLCRPPFGELSGP